MGIYTTLMEKVIAVENDNADTPQYLARARKKGMAFQPRTNVRFTGLRRRIGTTNSGQPTYYHELGVGSFSCQ